eukprot:s2397_g1.t1
MDDPVVELKERQHATVKVEKQMEDEALTRQQVYDFLVSERDRVRFCGTLPLTLLVWTHGNVERTSRAQSVIRESIDRIEVSHQISMLQGQAVVKRRWDVNWMIRLHNISSADEVWTWLIHGFVPLIAGSNEEPGVVRKFNQERMKRSPWDECGDCPVVEELQEYFRAECRTSERLPSRFGPEVNNTGAAVDRSFIAGGGIEERRTGEEEEGWKRTEEDEKDDGDGDDDDDGEDEADEDDEGHRDKMRPTSRD